MNEQSWMCVYCTRAKATCFCCCEDRETFLCEDCFCAHYKKNPLQVHLPVPTSAFGQHKNPRYFEHLQSRSARVPKAKSEILKNIDAIDQCIAELLQEIEIVAVQLNEFGSRVVSQLQELKSVYQREINAGIAEVERTMFEHGPALKNQFASLVRNFNGDPGTLVCFTYSVNSRKVLGVLDSICNFVAHERTIVVGIWKQQLTVHYPLLARSQQFRLPIGFGSRTRLCLLNDDQILAVEPKSLPKSAFFISVLTGEVLKRSAMMCARSCPGLICVNNTVYALGGKCNEAEKYVVSIPGWQIMPNVIKFLEHPVLCNFKGTIYVFDYLVLQVLNTSKEILENMNLPLGYHDVLFACVVDDQIMIVREAPEIYWWKPEDGSFEKQSKVKGEMKASQCQPVVRGRTVFFVSEANGQVNCLDIDLHSVTSV